MLSPEEMAMMSSGAAELRRLRRMGPKLTKHRPLERDVRRGDVPQGVRGGFSVHPSGKGQGSCEC